MAFHETTVRFDILSNIWRAVSSWPRLELCVLEGDSAEAQRGV